MFYMYYMPDVYVLRNGIGLAINDHSGNTTISFSLHTSAVTDETLTKMPGLASFQNQQFRLRNGQFETTDSLFMDSWR